MYPNGDPIIGDESVEIHIILMTDTCLIRKLPFDF